MVYHHTMTYKRKKEQKQWLEKIKKATVDLPHIVELEGDWSGHGYMDDIAEWCFDNIGDCEGDCEWYCCKDSYDKWYDKSGLDGDLDKLLEGTDKDQMSDIIDKHYKDIQKMKGSPPECHSHTGNWTAYCIIKTGYDSGIFRFYFKNQEDAIHCKIIWKG